MREIYKYFLLLPTSAMFFILIIFLFLQKRMKFISFDSKFNY